MNSRFKWTIVGSSTAIVLLLLVGARSSRAVSTENVYGHLKVYTEVLERIKLEYVEEPNMKSVTLGAIVLAGLIGILPRVSASTKGEGIERRYFYGAVWSITLAQTALLLLWKSLPTNEPGNIVKLVVYLSVLIVLGTSAGYGLLPRTRPILPGELMVAD